MPNSQIKSKKRVIDYGEVFTLQKEVDNMVNLVNQEVLRLDSRFLEPACGTGNFLIEIYNRKLLLVKKKFLKDKYLFEFNSVVATSSIYGIELLYDNTIVCRERLFELFKEVYLSLFPSSFNQNCLNTVKYILGKNIINANALTLKQENKNKTPIVFSEWSPVNKTYIQRRDFTFENLLSSADINSLPLFSDAGENIYIPKPLKSYDLKYFLELSNDK